MTQLERPIPSDHELEALLADTRALLAEKARWEDGQVNRDLDVLMHRVRGVKRGSYSQVLRERAQLWKQRKSKEAIEGNNRTESPQSVSVLPPWIGEEDCPDQFADQLARVEAQISQSESANQIGSYEDEPNAD
ncbi:hypothetical protein [Varibaculum sp.]|uniref:hypothetical protein n=1 Tax=Varibaculum sp. TaxID=1895474 RepID=UPI0009311877|nr:hypothetical protein [Varibaculum sp.]